MAFSFRLKAPASADYPHDAEFGLQAAECPALNP
jgi:hypothetical protein